MTRRPARLLVLVAALASIAWSGWLIGLQLWAGHHWRAAQDDLRQFRYAQAKRHLQFCHEIWPSDPAVLLAAARVTRRLQLFDDADAILKLYHKAHGEDDNLILETVLLRAERGDVDGVNAFCRALIEKEHPQRGAILEAMAAGLLRRFRVQDAAMLIEHWQNIEPESAQAWYFRGAVLQLRSDRAEAVKAFRRTLERIPGHDEARLRLTQVLLDLSQAREALPHLQHLSAAQPGNVALLVDLARCLDLLGRQDETEPILERARTLGPHNAAAMHESGLAALRRDRLSEAETWLKQACELSPGNFQSHFQLQLCLERLGKTEAARALDPQIKQLEADNKRFSQIVNEHMSRTPDDPALHHELGMIAMRAGSYDEGLRWFDSALQLDPRHSPTHEAYAAYYQATNQFGRAAKHLEYARPKKEGANR